MMRPAVPRRPSSSVNACALQLPGSWWYRANFVDRGVGAGACSTAGGARLPNMAADARRLGLGQLAAEIY